MLLPCCLVATALIPIVLLSCCCMSCCCHAATCCTAACYVVGRCYTSCRCSCAATCGAAVWLWLLQHGRATGRCCVLCCCCPATHCTAVTTLLPVMSWGTATCHVIAVVLLPVGHCVVTVAVVWSCHGALLCVMLQGAAAHCVATTMLPCVSPRCTGAHHATIVFAAHRAMALLQTCHGNHSHNNREVASLYCKDWTLTIPDSVLCASTCEGCLILLKQ